MIPPGSVLTSSQRPMQFHGRHTFGLGTGCVPVEVYRQHFLTVTTPDGQHITDIVGEWRITLN